MVKLNAIRSAVYIIGKKRIPGQLIIQMTDRCNARCPQCGMRVTEKFNRTKLSMDDARRIIDAAVKKGVGALSFTGGEPFLYIDELVSLIDYAGKAGIEYIRTGTNGYIFLNSERTDFKTRMKKIAEKLAGTTLRNFWISIDSADPMVHEKMRGFPGIISGIEKALPIFHSFGVYPSANLGINRNTGGDPPISSHAAGQYENSPFYTDFISAFQKFFRFVKNLGFTTVNCCYPMSVDDDSAAVYAATSTDSIVRFSPTEKSLIFKALMQVIPEFRHMLRIFSPRCSLYALHRQYAVDFEKAYPCRGGIDFFFVDSKDGNVYPCGYRGSENLGSLEALDLESMDTGYECYQCDWECFRDPSELFGPMLQALTDPIGLLRKVNRDGEFFKLWIGDLLYYRACDFFNGRKPPRYEKMARFEKTVKDQPFLRENTVGCRQG